VWLLLSVQLALLSLLQFGDIGFDHPGKYGLDFNSLILICIVYAVALIVGLARSVFERIWLAAVLQICVPIALFGYNHRPLPNYDASSNQYLIGKSKTEVDQILGTRGVMTSLEGHPEGDREFASYKGMTVIYSPDNRVIAVVPQEK